MNIMDIVALAKEGYKPSDIKELIALTSSQEGSPKEEKDGIQDKKTEQHEDGKERPEEAPKKSTEDSSRNDSVIDEYKKKVAELEQKVNDLQSKNVHKDYTDKDKKSDNDLINDITRSFM